MPEYVKKSTADAFCLREFLPYRLVVVADAVLRVFADEYEAHFNLTIPEWRILAAIAEQGAISPTRAGACTAMDKVKVSRAAQGLAGKGLIRSNPDPRDGRGRLLRLTRKGAATHQGILPLAASLEAELFDRLSRAERAALDRVLVKVSTRLETNRAIQTTGE